MMRQRKMLLAAIILGMASALPSEDLVDELPQMPDLKFGLFSGYIAALSERDMQTDPVIIWFNGGPGCSSLLGWAQEHGPYVIEDGAKNFTKNPYNWNQQATVIYIESPAGVGFSICGKQEECNFNDANSAEDNLIAVLNIMTMKFPELQKNPMYLSGESYAGIYVPYLAEKIDDYILKTKTGYVPNLKGFMVGNPVTSWKYDTTPAFFEMSFSHGLIDPTTYNNIKKDCPNVFTTGDNTPECNSLMNTWYGLTESVNIYDVYGKCYGAFEPLRLHFSKQDIMMQSDQTIDSTFTAREYTPYIFEARDRFYRSSGFRKSLSMIPPCVYAQPIQDYLNNPSVRFNLNIPNEAPSWDLCASISYERGTLASLEIYKKLKGKYRMLVFSGDTDGAVATIGTQGWIQELNWEVAELWRPYYVNRQLAGYVEVREDETFVFATVHGAGHMAAQWKRPETYHVIFNFINGKRL